MDIKINDLIIPKFQSLLMDVLQHRYTHYWLSGGRASTKSSFCGFAPPLLLISNPNIHALVLRKVGATLKDSVYNQILWSIDKLGLNDYFRATLSPLEITYLPTQQKIFFRSGDDPVKIKSIKPKFGYIGVTFFEEVDQFQGMEEIRNILQSVNRGGDKYWNFYSFNPPKSKDNWANVEVLTKRPDKIHVHSCYLDVPREWLGELMFLEAEHLKEVNPRAYEHEYLGLATGSGGDVFENLDIREITDEEINNIGYYYAGTDFGFNVDPLASVLVGYDSKRRTLYFINEVYGVKLSNREAVKKISKMIKGYVNNVVGDSAEPRTIAEFNELGLKTLPAKKGKDSVNSGVKWLQDLEKIVIDPQRTPNAWREFVGYEYDMDRHGNFISRYPDRDNHTIDATRYALESVIRSRTVRWI